MFDPDVIHLIEGVNIDGPINALTLTHDMHHLLGSFQAYFEPAINGVHTNHTYKIDSIDPEQFFRNPPFPVIRSDNRSIDPPSARLLAIHRAIAKILYLSAAGEYINRILDDLDELVINEDGSTELGHLVGLRLNGWLHGISVY